MALDKATLEAAIIDALTPPVGAAQTVDQIAAKLATAIDTYTKGATLNGTASGVTAGAATSGPLAGGLL